MLVIKLDKPTIKPDPIHHATLVRQIDSHIHSKKIPFQNWAFGANGYSESNLWKAWNTLHGATYPLYPDDIAQNDLDMMQRLYDQCFKRADKSASCEVKEMINESTKPEVKSVDKKMHKVTESMKKAQSDIKKHMPSKAQNVLKGAEKANEKLVKVDREVRDPIIEKAKKAGIKAPKKMGK